MNKRKSNGNGALCLAVVLLAGGTAGVRAQNETQEAVEEPKKVKWERSASVGFTLTRGNSETILFTGNVIGIRKWDKNEVTLGANAAHGKNDGITNTENFGASGQYNRLFSERAFGYFRVDALHDAIADVELRLTVGPGGGYYFIKNDRTSLSGELGPSFVYERLGSGDNSYLSVRIGERFEHKLSDRSRIWQTAEFLPQVDDLNNFLLRLEIGLESDLTKRLSLEVKLQDVYDNEPAPGRESNDLKLISGIKYKF